MTISNPKRKNFIEVARRVQSATWWGTDPTGIAKAPFILAGETMDAYDTTTGVLVPFIGVDSSDNVYFPSPVYTVGSIAVAAPAGTKLQNNALTLNYAGSISVAGAGLLVALRGDSVVANGTTFASGFLYGAEGKVYVQGTLSTANYVAGLVGQVDTSAAQALGTTPLAAIWGDMGATSTAVTATGADILKLTNTTNTIINSAIMVAANATYLIDISDLAYGGAHFVVGTTASTAAGCLKVHVNGNVRYLQLYSAEA